MIYSFPNEIITLIYSYDDTYRDIYTNGPLSTLKQINFYKVLIERNKKYIRILQKTNLVDVYIIKKEVINELNLNNKFSSKYSIEYYENLYNIYGRLYLNILSYINTY